MSTDPEQELLRLWRERRHLDQASWAQLYANIYRLLMNCRSPRITAYFDALPLTREECINDFFVVKVFTANATDELHHANALIEYFRRYLEDLRRKTVRQVSLETAAGQDNPDQANTTPHGDIESQLRRLEEATGMHAGELAASARMFFRQLPAWAQLYLQLHACAKHPEPLSSLAKRLTIASHHYKARELGITRKKGEFETGYEKTRLGRWLVSVRLQPIAENIGCIRLALDILCQQALRT